MRPLEKEYEKNGYTYLQVYRSDTEAIYKQKDGDRNVGYEVGRIKTAKAGEIFGNKVPAREVFWNNEDFGVIAWSVATLNKAYKVVDEIQKGERIKTKEK